MLLLATVCHSLFISISSGQRKRQKEREGRERDRDRAEVDSVVEWDLPIKHT